jgi:hypothetical protein
VKLKLNRKQKVQVSDIRPCRDGRATMFKREQMLVNKKELKINDASSNIRNGN